MYGLFPDREVNPFDGGILTTISTVAAQDKNGSFYGASLETPMVQPALASAMLPFFATENAMSSLPFPVQFKSFLAKLRHTAVFIVLQRDKNSIGRVRLDSFGDSLVSFSVSKHDANSLVRGMKYGLHILESCGAHELGTFLEDIPRVQLSTQNDRSEQFDRFLHEIQKSGMHPPRNTSLGSAHQMGSCRLGVSPKMGACKPTGQLWECDDVWVCDGSLFPTASGVNPMVTIYATADMVAQECVHYMQSMKKAKL